MTQHCIFSTNLNTHQVQPHCHSRKSATFRGPRFHDHPRINKRSNRHTRFTPASNSAETNGAGSIFISEGPPPEQKNSRQQAQQHPNSHRHAERNVASTQTIEDDPGATYIRLVHVILFCAILVIGTIFVTMTIHFKHGTGLVAAFQTFFSKMVKSMAFKQLVVIASAIILVRFGLNNFVQFASKIALLPVQFDRTKTYYFLKEVYQPLELLLFIAGMCTLADAFVPHLVSGLSKNIVANFVRCTLAVSFIVTSANIIMRIKRQFCQENAWQAEMNGDVTAQRRWEAYDKLGTFAVYVLAFIFVVQAVGLEVTSVLAIGGVGGLAVGLAGREIVENLFNGFLILTSNPFEVGEEIVFYPGSQKVEGIVTDIGWYRTLIRSFEREVYVIPNAAFSKNTVLNITRKGREWRFFEFLSIRVQDVNKVSAIISDIRRIIKNDPRIINNLHKRVYLEKITLEDIKIYISFYVEATSRDIFMTYKQDFLLGFVDCIHRNTAQLAQAKLMVEVVGAPLPPSLTGGIPTTSNRQLTTGDDRNPMLSSMEESSPQTPIPSSEPSKIPLSVLPSTPSPPSSTPQGAPLPSMVYASGGGGAIMGGGTVLAASIAMPPPGTPWWQAVTTRPFWQAVLAPLFEEKLY